jgi:predicted nucleotidyltransferase
MGTSEVKNGEGARGSVADALFTGTRQTLLRLFFGHPDRGYTLTDLIGLAQAGRGAVQRETARLVQAGLISHEGERRGSLYRANADSPIFDELCSIARKILGPADVLRTALAPLEPRIRLALLFGSVAQGVDRADSDIDVLIVADDLMLEEVFEALAEAEQTLGRRISPTLYTSEEFDRRRAERGPFVTEVLNGVHQRLLGAME